MTHEHSNKPSHISLFSPVVQEIIGYTLVGAWYGGFWGSYISYRTSPIIIGGRMRDVVIRQAIRDVTSSAFWVGAASGSYAIANHLSIVFRGTADVNTPIFGGLASGFLLSRFSSLSLPFTFLLTAGTAAAARILDGFKYDTTARGSHHIFMEISAMQELKAREAYKHAMHKADEENYKNYSKFEDMMAAKVREKL